MQSDDVKNQLRQIQQDLLKRQLEAECRAGLDNCYLPADTMADHFEQLERLNECLAKPKDSNDARQQLTQILATQERIAKAVETLVEQTKPREINVQSQFPSVRIPEILSTMDPKYKPETFTTPKTQETPRTVYLAFTLDELEYLEGWYEYAISSEMTTCLGERELMSRLRRVIDEMEKGIPELDD